VSLESLRMGQGEDLVTLQSPLGKVKQSYVEILQDVHILVTILTSSINSKSRWDYETISLSGNIP